MSDHAPATPGAPTPRHLKRLSLNTAAGSTSTSPVASIRLSTSSTSSSPVRQVGSPSTSLAHEASTTPTRTTPRSAHARRTSSISYAKSPTLQGGAFDPDSPLRGAGSPNPNAPRASFEGIRPLRPSLDGLDDARAEAPVPEVAAGVTTNGTERRIDPSPLARQTIVEEEPLNLGSGSALGIVNAQSTLTEQNADLLSFIAKKERKCLDLREELKRHEAELGLLKRKWETIVARSLHQQQQQPATRHAPSQSISTASSASPNTSPTPRSATLHPATTLSASSHSLDLSLLSTTFDASDLLASNHHGDSGHRSAGSDPQIEIPESVKAAGNWLGGALGRVLEAAVGMPPPAEAPGEKEPLEGKRRERDGGTGMLESLQEEDEGDEGEDNVDENRRESHASSVETESTTSGASVTKGSTAASSVHDEEAPRRVVQTSPLRRKPAPESSASSSSSTSRRLFTSPPPASTTQNSSSLSSSSSSPHAFPPASTSTSTSPSHARTRSSLASFTTDSWSSLNKRWTNLTESDAFQHSKRATLGLVDTFEQGLAQALGPLEPPSLSSSPVLGRRGSIPSPFLGHSSPSSPNPAAAGNDLGTASGGATGSQQQQQQQQDRRLTEVPISPMPGQALSSVFASWNKGKDRAAAVAPATAKAPLGGGAGSGGRDNPNQNGFDWSAFQDDGAHNERERERDDEVEEDWPAW